MKTKRNGIVSAILMIVTNIVTLGAGANEAPAHNAAGIQTLSTQIAPDHSRADGRQRSRCGADARGDNLLNAGSKMVTDPLFFHAFTNVKSENVEAIHTAGEAGLLRRSSETASPMPPTTGQYGPGKRV